jgi:hypothetical protein
MSGGHTVDQRQIQAGRTRKWDNPGGLRGPAGALRYVAAGGRLRYGFRLAGRCANHGAA